MNLSAFYVVVRNHRDFELELPCQVTQDSGVGFLSETCVIWSDEADALFAQYGFDAEEMAGAVEAAEDCFWAHEQEQCRKTRVSQQLEVTAAE